VLGKRPHGDLEDPTVLTANRAQGVALPLVATSNPVKTPKLNAVTSTSTSLVKGTELAALSSSQVIPLRGHLPRGITDALPLEIALLSPPLTNYIERGLAKTVPHFSYISFLIY